MRSTTTTGLTWIAALAASALAAAQPAEWNDREDAELRAIVAAGDPSSWTPPERELAPLYARHGRGVLAPLAALAAPHSTDELRTRASLLLAWLGDRRAIPGLVLALREEPRIAPVLLGFLGSLGAREHVPIVCTLIEERRLGRDGVDALAAMGDPRAIPTLVAALDHSGEDARKVIPIALARLRAREAVPRIVELVADPSPWVRKYAVMALGELGAVEATPRIEPLLADGEVWVRLEVVVALARLGAPGAIPRLLARLSELDYPLMRSAVAVLASLPAEERVRGLARAGRGRHGEAALLELVRLGTTDALDAVAAALPELAPWSRVVVAGALLAAGDPRGEAPLQAALAAEDTEGSRADLAAVLLARAGAPTALERLRKALDHPDDAELRVAAAYATSLLGPERLPLRALENLVERTGNDPFVGWHLERAWAMRRGTAGCSTLIRLAGDRWDTEPLLLAITGLAAIGDVDAPALAFLLESLDDHRRASFTISVHDLEGRITIHRAAASALARIAGDTAPTGPFDTPDAESAAWRAWARARPPR